MTTFAPMGGKHGRYILLQLLHVITVRNVCIFFSCPVSVLVDQEMAEMYVGDDVSPDFYGWVFPKYDHVGVGTGTVVNRPAIKEYQVCGVEMALPFALPCLGHLGCR